MTCHGVPAYVISGGRVVLDENGLHVEKGSGRFIPNPPFSEHVYAKLIQREKATETLTGVERKPYSGPTIQK